MKNPRINITFEQKTTKKTISNFVKKLILQALSHREDMVLSSIAESRDIKNAKEIDHEDAWK